MIECIFCKIAEHEMESDIVWENDRFIAFRDINPKAKVHVLLIPKRHTTSISTLSESDSKMLGEMIINAKQVAEKLGILEGFRLVFNSGSDAGMEVDHLHLHILGGERLGHIA